MDFTGPMVTGVFRLKATVLANQGGDHDPETGSGLLIG